MWRVVSFLCFFFKAEDGIRDSSVTGVQTCALPILIHFNLENPEWVLPDRTTIPHNVAFFQNLRNLLPDICHKHGMLAIGGMTALYPSREDAELNARALKVLAEDKKNEANSLMDGAWTGHPDQNEIAVSQFP